MARAMERARFIWLSPVRAFRVQRLRSVSLRRSHSSHTVWNNDDSKYGRRRSETRRPGPSRARPDRARIDAPAKPPFLNRTSPGTSGAGGAACIPETARSSRSSQTQAGRESRSALKARLETKSYQRQSKPAQRRNGQSRRWPRSHRRDRRTREISVSSCCSEDQSEPGNYRSRLKEMRAAKRRQKIVQSDGIREVLDLDRCDEPPWTFGVEQVIGARLKTWRGVTRSGL